MILTVDIGNSNIVVGAFEEDALLFSARLHTLKNKLAEEYAIDLRNLFVLHGALGKIEGAILSSVVPALAAEWQAAIRSVCGLEPIVAGPGIKTGLNIRIDNPAQLGTDILADDVGAFASFPAPVMVFDLGTSTTISVVDEGRNILGCAIMPGVRLSLDALSAKAAQLPEISLEAPKNIIGTNTLDSMRAGVIFGTASMMDGMIERVSEWLGKTPAVVATGGMSEYIVPHCKHTIHFDPILQLHGLLILYKKNSK